MVTETYDRYLSSMTAALSENDQKAALLVISDALGPINEGRAFPVVNDAGSIAAAWCHITNHPATSSANAVQELIVGDHGGDGADRATPNDRHRSPIARSRHSTSRSPIRAADRISIVMSRSRTISPRSSLLLLSLLSSLPISEIADRENCRNSRF